MKKQLLALFMGTALVLGACGGGDDAAEPAEDTTEQPAGEATEEQPAEGGGETAEGGETGGATADAGAGEELYKQSCASCHGQNLEGGVGPNLTAVGGKLDAAGIQNVIENGQGAMPPGLLKGDDAAAVAAWLAEHK
ncbi:cytochrome c551 [Bacillus sp. Marseille-P3661]|uniref:cytochrome c551 n=1 Tax=Bacillus sp. Marseille-P3661 TaxID=1936234 RepID=UPI000C84637F|nr:cytochrome c [Bacillus sp. Marseille-P3661]